MQLSTRLIILSSTILLVSAGVSNLPGQTPAPAEKKIAFEMRGVPWNRVLEWLTDHSGLPITAHSPPPAGSFTFISPVRGKDPATYAVGEIVDLINEQLLARKYLLIRQPKALVLVCTDDKIEPGHVPHIEIGDLAKRGSTELVSITLAMEKIGGPDDLKEIRKLMGPFGVVVVLDQGKRVVLQDTARTLRKICKIAGADQPPADSRKEPAKKDNKAMPPEKQDDLLLRFYFLTEITKSAKGMEAILHDRATNRSTRLRVSSAYVTLTFLADEDMKTEIRIKVVRIDPREVYFQAGSRIYALRLGQNLQEAVARPLDADDLKKLGLTIEK